MADAGFRVGFSLGRPELRGRMFPRASMFNGPRLHPRRRFAESLISYLRIARDLRRTERHGLHSGKRP
jgi:hypothetical protein